MYKMGWSYRALDLAQDLHVIVDHVYMYGPTLLVPGLSKAVLNPFVLFFGFCLHFGSLFRDLTDGANT